MGINRFKIRYSSQGYVKTVRKEQKNLEELCTLTIKKIWIELWKLNTKKQLFL